MTLQNRLQRRVSRNNRICKYSLVPISFFLGRHAHFNFGHLVSKKVTLKIPFCFIDTVKKRRTRTRREELNCLCIFDNFARRVAGAYFEESKFIIYFLILCVPKCTVLVISIGIGTVESNRWSEPCQKEY